MVLLIEMLALWLAAAVAMGAVTGGLSAGSSDARGLRPVLVAAIAVGGFALALWFSGFAAGREALWLDVGLLMLGAYGLGALIGLVVVRLANRAPGPIHAEAPPVPGGAVAAAPTDPLPDAVQPVAALGEAALSAESPVADAKPARTRPRKAKAAKQEPTEAKPAKAKPAAPRKAPQPAEPAALAAAAKRRKPKA